MKNFILINDFKAIATSEDLSVLTDDNDLIIKQCNAIAVDEAAAYLSAKYDVEDLFKDPKLYSINSTYILGDRIYIQDLTITTSVEYKHYTCIASGATAGTLLTNTLFFEEIDSRDQKLMEVVMSISLFYIHKRLSPNQIPLFRILSYDGNGDEKIMSAIAWLKLIQKGSLSPYGWQLLSSSTEEIDPEVPVDFDKLGNDPSLGIMWGNDMGEEYIWYANGYDKNIIQK